MPKLHVRLVRDSAMRVFDVSVSSQKLVYVIRLDKRIRYRHGSSYIAYIGSTQNGISRMAGSAAKKAQACLTRYGVKEFNVYVVTSRGKPGAKAWWRKLERALLIAFKQRYGDIPEENTQGRNFIETDEFEMFSRDSIMKILKDIEKITKPRRRARRRKANDLLRAEELRPQPTR